MKRSGLALVLLFLTACGDTLPAPEIHAISPAETEEGTAPQVRLDVEAIYPFVADYGSETSEVDATVTIRIGGVPITGATVQPDGAITGLVPYSLAPAAHDVRLDLADGRSAILTGGFTVKQGAFPETFSFDPIPNQRRNRPFEITVRAVGGRAGEFKGVVQLESSRGLIVPLQSDAFTAGVLTQTVTIFSNTGEVTITARDAQGHTGTSNAFRLEK